MDDLLNPVREPESLAVIRFQDCDPFGHLNNARYLDYFLNARQDQIAEHYGLRTYERDNPMQASWVVRRTQIAYLRPVPAMDEVLIRTRLIHFTETSLVVEGLMLDKEARHLKALVWFEFVHVSLVSGRPVGHSDELMRLFRSVTVAEEEYDPYGFNRRVEAVHLQFRNHSPKEEEIVVGSE